MLSHSGKEEKVGRRHVMNKFSQNLIKFILKVMKRKRPRCYGHKRNWIRKFFSLFRSLEIEFLEKK